MSFNLLTNLNHWSGLSALLFFALLSPTLEAQNLLENSGLESSDYTGWTVVADGGDGASFSAQGYDGTTAIRTSYDWTTLSQEIDLLAAGYTAEWLDESPIVRYADWIIGTGIDFADEYQLTIELRDAGGTALAAYTSGTLYAPADSSWMQIKQNFNDYPAGVRSIYVERRGRDAEFWAGNYGLIMDAAYLSIGNIFLNADAKTEDLSGWTVDADGGDGWRIRSGGFQTSYSICEKSQVVDLLELGYTAAELDAEPIIDIMENYIGYASGSSTADEYYLNIELQDELGNMITSMNSGTLICSDVEQTTTAQLTGYGPGVRQIKLTHGGTGVNFWAGHYGSIMSGTWGKISLRPANDDACNAIAVSTDGTPSTGHTNENATVPADEAALVPPTGTTGSYGCNAQDGWCSDGLGIENGIWFSFVAPATGDVVITTCDLTDLDTQLALYASADCTDLTGFSLLLANDDDEDCTNFNSTITAEDLTLGQTYYILLDGFDGDTSDDIGISVTEFDNTPSGIKDIAAQNDALSIFPNPVGQGSILNAQLKNATRGTVQIQFFDILGKMVHQETVEKGTEELQVQLTIPNLPAGQYLIRMVGDELSATKKFTVK